MKDEDFGDGKVSRLLFKAAEAGAYKIVATTFKPGMAGPFTLVVAEADVKPAQVLPLKLEGGKAAIDGALTEQDAVDAKGRRHKAYALQAEKGKFYRFEMAGKGGLDPYVRIEDAKGNVVKEEDLGDVKMSRVTFRANQAGTYHVIATTFKPGATGEFRLTAALVEIKEAKAQALDLQDGKAEVKAELTAADGRLVSGKLYKEYTFTAEAGRSYKIDLHSKAFDAYLYLKDASGKTLTENDDADPPSLDAGLVFKAAKAGTYHVIATSLGGNGTGPFVLTIGAPSPLDKLMATINAFQNAKPDRHKQILQELREHLEGVGDKLSPREAEQVVKTAYVLEQTDKQLAAEAYARLGKALAGSADADVARQGKLLNGAAKRLNLVGQPIQVQGKTFGGGTLDLAKLKGKVVLIDFWASWCGPCKAELPNVRKQYAKYHDQGFEVIGISLDTSEKAMAGFLEKEKLPWQSIWKEDADALADAYGVFGIPLAVLVGRDGRVISLHARGEELGRLLEEQFGKK